MREHFHLGFLEGIWIPLLVISFASSCSKTDQTTSRDVQPVALLAAATIPPTNHAPDPAPVTALVAAPNRPTAAERLVEIDRLLARPLTGTPESADERTLLRAERAALIGGTFELLRPPEGGTRVRLTVPLEPDPAAGSQT